MKRKLYMCDVCGRWFPREEVVKVQLVYVCGEHYDPSDGEPEDFDDGE